ncbi:MAG: sigma-70 family RNA polymerase sigma factor [Acidobacteriota bacterium]
MERSEAEVAAELTERIHRGDRTAEEELVHRYSRGLLFHLRRTAGDPDLADDLHQETFRVVLERLRGEGIADPERLAGFILGTGRNLFLGGWRKRARRGEGTSLDALEGAAAEPPDPVPGQLDRVLQEEEILKVRRLIGELGTDRDRQILFRFYVAEEGKERICADLGLSSLHFNRVLFRARQRFKELLQ